MAFQKSISKLELLFAAVGGIVGSGWLLGPFYTAKVAGPAAIAAWAVGGILMMFIAFTFAELATAFPVAGGTVRFAEFSHGRFASFNIAWVFWLAAVMVAPIESMAAIQYASNYAPSLVTQIAGHTHLSHIGIATAAVVMLIMCAINMGSIRYFSKSNIAVAGWKILIPVVVAIILLCEKFHPGNFTQFGGFAPAGIKGILTALPTAGVIFSFIGYSPAIQLAEEAKNPQRAVPFAIVGSIVIAIVIYVLVEIGFVGVINPVNLAHGWSHLSFFGDAGPIAGILSALGVGWFLKVVYFDAFVSPLGTAYVYTAASARVNYAMSKTGNMPSFIQSLNRHGSPWKAIILNFVIGMFFFLPFPGWQAMVSFLVSCFVFAYAIGPIACVKLRRTMPDVKRPFKVPAPKVFCFIAFYICNLIILWTGWGVVWKMLITFAIGYAYFAIQNKVSATKEPVEFKRGFWFIPYLVGMGVISCVSTFGGAGIMPFGIDFAVMAVFSAIIYVVAIK